jgi:hypothetical protein
VISDEWLVISKNSCHSQIRVPVLFTIH